MPASCPLPPAMPSCLPGMDKLWPHAMTVTEISAWLLATVDAPLLCVVQPQSGRSRLVVMDAAGIADLPRTRHLAAGSRNRATLRRILLTAANVLFEDLQQRWPPQARPLRLGMITDGARLAFSPDDPWPLAAGWISRRSRGAGLIDLLQPATPDPGCD